jgi:hypothetical protein
VQVVAVEAIAAEARARGARKLLCGSWVAIRPPDGSTRRAASSPRHLKAEFLLGGRYVDDVLMACYLIKESELRA